MYISTGSYFGCLKAFPWMYSQLFIAISSCTHQYSQSIKPYLCLSLVPAVNTSRKGKGKNSLLRAYSSHCNHKSSLTFCVTKNGWPISPLWSHVKRFCLQVKRIGFKSTQPTGSSQMNDSSVHWWVCLWLTTWLQHLTPFYNSFLH